MQIENQVMPSPQRAMDFFGGPEDGPAPADVSGEGGI